MVVLKKCVRCGKLVEEKFDVCDNCGFDFLKYEAEQKVFKKEEEPIVPRNIKTNLIDNPVFTFIFGILAILSSLHFVTSKGIVVEYLIYSVIYIFITMVFSIKQVSVKMKEVRNVGKWMGNIAFAITLYKIVYEIFGIFI